MAISADSLIDTTVKFNTATWILGVVLVAKMQEGLCAVFLGDSLSDLTKSVYKRFPHAQWSVDDTVLNQAVVKLIQYLEKPNTDFDFPLVIRGTPFQREVWKVLRTITLGQTMSYTDVARRIGLPKAVRAVARACAVNDLAIVIPCHRVLRKDASLSGYRWGVHYKRALLERERQYHLQ